MADDVISIKVIAESSSVDKTNNRVDNLASTLLKTEREINKVKKAFKVLDKAANTGQISMQKYSQLSNTLNTTEARLYSSIGKTTTAVNKQNAALKSTKPAATKASSSLNQVATSSTNAAAAAARFANQQRMAGKSTNKFGMVTQQVGYQVGDFFVQVQSGTDALVAFGQQGTQLAGLLPGLAGAILGIGLSLGTALLRAGLEAKNLTINFKAIKKSLGDALSPLRPMIDAISSAFASLGVIASDVGNIILTQFARIIAYITAAAILLATKLVAGFILSGKAATAFFRILKAGLISTGIGLFVVALGEIILAMNNLIIATGSFGKAMREIKTVFKAIWEYAGAKIDVYAQKLRIIGPAFRSWMMGIVNVIIIGAEKAIGKLIDIINVALDKFGGEGIRRPNFANALLDTKAVDAQVKNETYLLTQLETKADDAAASLGNAALALFGLATTAAATNSMIDTSNWLMTDPGDGKDKLVEEIRQIRLQQQEEKALIGLRGEKLLQMQFEYQLKAAMDEDYNKSHDAKIEAISKELAAEQQRIDKLKEVEQQQKDLADSIAGSMGDAFMSMIEGTKSVKDAFKDMARAIIKELYEVLVVQQLVGDAKAGTGIAGGIMNFFGSANGNAMYGGNVIPYANGGVVGGPTTFPMSAGRTGLMGEAGPEAIMPLKRGANGKLGVQAEGGSGDVVIHQNFNFAANGDESVKKLIAQAAPQIANMTKSSIISDRRRGGQMKATFG
jgi:hypothetical protein